MNPRKGWLAAVPLIGAVLLLYGLLALLQAQPGRAAGTIHYVAPDGDCAGKTPCYSTLQAAVDAAGAGDEIRLAGGLYQGVSERNGTQQIALIDKALTVRGGYNSGDWDNPDPAAHPTVLDPQQAGRGLTLWEAGVEIENLRIAHGAGQAAQYAPNPEIEVGGGLYAISSTVTLRSVEIAECQAALGGGIFTHNSRFTLLDSAILTNTAEAWGGGLNLSSSESRLENNLVAGNSALNSGGLEISHGSSLLKGNTIQNNLGQHGAGGLNLYRAKGAASGNIIRENTGGGRGGAYVFGDFDLFNNEIAQNTGGGIELSGGRISLVGNAITGNTTSGRGGGVYILFHRDPDTSPPVQDLAPKIISHNLIQGNQAEDGGGLYIASGKPILRGNLIEGNEASGYGGGLYLDSTSMDASGDRILENSSGGAAGGMFINLSEQASLSNILLINNQTAGEGAALYSVRSEIALEHGTLVGNQGSSAVHLSADPGSLVTMTNSILAGHTLGVSALAGSQINIDGVLWFDNGTNYGGAGSLTVSHELEGDPLLTADFHLGMGSPAIDAGQESGLAFDFELEPRAYGAHDLGADEYWPSGVLQRFYLPLAFQEPVFDPLAPAGSYACVETGITGDAVGEFALTLNPDGTSQRSEDGTPVEPTVGTWSFSTTTGLVDLPEFGFERVRFTAPDRLAWENDILHWDFAFRLTCSRLP